MSRGGLRREFLLLCLYLRGLAGGGFWGCADKVGFSEALYMARGRDEKKEEKK